MNTPIRTALACLAYALPLSVIAQTVPAPASSTGMNMQDMQDMPGMTQQQPAPSSKQKPTANNATSSTPKALDSCLRRNDGERQGCLGARDGATGGKQFSPSSRRKPGTSDSNPPMHPAHPTPAMPGMDHMNMQPQTAHAGMDHDDHAMHDMRMQGGRTPADARSADYSEGASPGHMAGMEMLDAKPLGMLLFDQLEAFHGNAGNGQQWELQGWYGTDSNKLWVRSEGERVGGQLGDGDIEALWSHAVAPFWDTQLGVRHDFGPGPARDWAAFGVQGLAPYWFELSATAYAGSNGRTAARLRVDYELLFTQRLILQPELEVNAYGKADPQRRLGSGVSDASFGLRLRYEFSRQFAPYVGVTWTQRYGGTATFARAAGLPAFDRQWVAGVRFWF